MTFREYFHPIWALLGLPALPLLPFIFSTPLGINNSAAREIAGYFQALAFLQDDFTSFTYLTLFESDSALHLHSLLSSVLLGFGLHQAGRILSLLAAIGASILLAALVARWFSSYTGFIAGAFLWVHPLYTRFASRWYPESIGILLTIAVMYAVHRDIENPSIKHLSLALIFLALAISNHMWEATIALPATVAYVLHSRYKRAGGIIAGTIGSIGLVEAISALQPTSHNLSADFAVFNHPELLFTIQWFFRYREIIPDPLLADPFQLSISWTAPIAAVLCTAAAIRAVTSRDRRMVTLVAWFVSGFSILVLLPRGWKYHDYYLWALLAPMAMTAGIFLEDAVRTMGSPRQVLAAGIAVVLIGATLGSMIVAPVSPSHIYQTGPYSTDEISKAGSDLGRMMTEEQPTISFTGPLARDTGENRVIRSRILMHARLNVQSVSFEASDAIRFNTTSDCDYYVDARDGKMIVDSC